MVLLALLVMGIPDVSRIIAEIPGNCSAYVRPKVSLEEEFSTLPMRPRKPWDARHSCTTFAKFPVKRRPFDQVPDPCRHDQQVLGLRRALCKRESPEGRISDAHSA